MTISLGILSRRRLTLGLANREAAKEIADAIESASTATAAVDQFLLVPLPDLDANESVVNLNLFLFDDFQVTIQGIKLIAQGAFAGVDNSNTMVVAVKDADGHTIVTKTYNAGTVPTDNGANALGTLDATHKILNAGEECTISITNGTTADPPPLIAQIRYRQTG